MRGRRDREGAFAGGCVQHQVQVAGGARQAGCQARLLLLPVGCAAPGCVPAYAVVARRWIRVEGVAVQGRVGGPQGRQRAAEAAQFVAGRGGGPVEPGQFIVVAVGVVVAALGARQLVAAEQQRRAEGQEQGSQQVLALAQPDGADGGIVGGSLDAVVGAQVVVAAVAVALAVGLVVRGRVADQVVQGEAVVAGDEVDAVRRAPAVALVQVGAPRQPGSQGGGGAVAAPEAAHVVAEAVVEFRPPVARELAHLVGAGGVPRLGDDLGVAQHRILTDLFKDRRVGAQVAGAVAAEHRRQVESEAVDVHLHHPVVQAVDDHAPHHRVVAVQGVAAAGEIQVAAAVAGIEQVVDAVVQAAVGEGGAGSVALGGVVEDHVQNDLDPGRVQRAHHLLELGHLPAGFGCGAVAALRGEQADRVVAPVVDQRRGIRVRGPAGSVLVGLVHGQQFDRGHAERPQVGNALAEAEEGAWLRASGARMGGESARVHLVDQAAVQRVARVAVVPPVEGRVHDDAARLFRQQLGSPSPRGHGAGERLGVGIEQQPLCVEAMAVPRRERSVDPVQVAPAGAHAPHQDVPYVPGAVLVVVQGYLGGWLRGVTILVQQQRHCRGMPTEQGKLSAAFKHGGAERHRTAPAHRERGRGGGHGPIGTTTACHAQRPTGNAR